MFKVIGFGSHLVRYVIEGIQHASTNGIKIVILRMTIISHHKEMLEIDMLKYLYFQGPVLTKFNSE